MFDERDERFVDARIGFGNDIEQLAHICTHPNQIDDRALDLAQVSRVTRDAVRRQVKTHVRSKANLPIPPGSVDLTVDPTEAPVGFGNP